MSLEGGKPMGMEKQLVEPAPVSKIPDKKEKATSPLMIGTPETSAAHQQAAVDDQTGPKDFEPEVEADVEPEVRGGLAAKLHRVVAEIRQLAEDLDELADMLGALHALLSGFEILGNDEEDWEEPYGNRRKRDRSAKQSKGGTDIDLEKILSLAADSSELAKVSALLKQIRSREK